MNRRVRTPEAADYLGLSPRTLEQMRYLGRGPAYVKVGRAVLYEITDLDTWLDQVGRRCEPQELAS